MSDDVQANLLVGCGDEIEDAAEETFLVFSQSIPSNNLGILDPKAPHVELEIAGRDYRIQQSSSLLNSTRGAGTTGAMLWKITPLVADWLASKDSILWTRGILSPSSTILELGCGIAGLMGLVLAEHVTAYVLTDQEYVMKVLRENLTANQKKPATTSKVIKNRTVMDNKIRTFTLDWEHDSVANLSQVIPNFDDVHLLILCDLIYNSYLIKPLVQVCQEICRLNTRRSPVLLVAQQLRTDDVFEEWLSTLIEYFTVYRVSDEHVPSSLKSGSGYIVHLAILRI